MCTKYLFKDDYGIIEHKEKTLIRLGRCPGWSTLSQQPGQGLQVPSGVQVRLVKLLRLIRVFAGLAYQVLSVVVWLLIMSRAMGKPAFAHAKAKPCRSAAGNRPADQRLCFHYI